MTSPATPQPGDSVAYRSSNPSSMGVVWGLLVAVNDDQTLDVRTGYLRKQHTISASRLVRWEAGGSRFERQFTSARRPTNR